MTKSKNMLMASLGEGGLLLIVAAAGWAAHFPFIFASLGPSAYELVEKPTSPSSKTYNIILGHYIGLGAGFFALWSLGAWSAPHVTLAGCVAPARIWAAVIAAVITTAGTLAVNASQPASLSTTLLVSLGAMQTARGALAIAVGVVIIAVIGFPVRKFYARALPSS